MPRYKFIEHTNMYVAYSMLNTYSIDYMGNINFGDILKPFVKPTSVTLDIMMTLAVNDPHLFQI